MKVGEDFEMKGKLCEIFEIFLFLIDNLVFETFFELEKRIVNEF